MNLCTYISRRKREIRKQTLKQRKSKEAEEVLRKNKEKLERRKQEEEARERDKEEKELKRSQQELEARFAKFTMSKLLKA